MMASSKDLNSVRSGNASGRKHLVHRAKWIAGPVVLAGVSLFGSDSTYAATKVWSGSVGSTDWATGANWGGIAPVSGDFLQFTSANASTSTTLTDTLSSFNVAGINFTAGALAYTMTGNAFVLTADINNAGTNLETINNAFSLTSVKNVFMTSGGGDITLGGNISGTNGGLAEQTAGTLTLSGNNTYTGATSTNSRNLCLIGNANNGGATNNGTNTSLSNFTALTIGNGSTIQLRDDVNNTFQAASITAGSNTITIDVNNTTGLAANGTNKTLTMLGWTGLQNATFNVTGGNGYSLSMGALTANSSSNLFTNFNPAAGVGLAITTFTGSASFNSTLNFGGAGTTTIGAITAGTGKNVKVNLTAGLVILTATNSMGTSSQANVNGGTLQIDGSLSSATAVTVGGSVATNAPTLTGIGTISGSVNISAANGGTAGTISAGDGAAVGVLNTGNLTVGGTLRADVDTTSNTADKVAVTGTVNVTGATLQLSILPANTIITPYNNTFVLIDNDSTDAITGSFAGFTRGGVNDSAAVTFLPLQGTLYYSYNSSTSSLTGGNDLAVVFTAVPEPSSLCTLGLCMGGLLARRRRSRIARDLA